MTLEQLRIVVLMMPQIVLLARTIGWEAPPWAAQDRPYVAAVIRLRMIEQAKTIEEIVFAPRQFSPATAGLLKKDPAEMGELMELAIEAWFWQENDLPIKANHFYSPLWRSYPPSWADSSCEVFPETKTIHRFFYLQKGQCP